MLTGSPATPAEARDFCARWPRTLQDRLTWFASEMRSGNPDVAALDRLVREVADQLGADRPVEPVPEWYDDSLAGVGWSAYGAALAEGLMGYVAAVYADRLGRELPWAMDEDPKSAYHLKPVVDLPGVAPPWRQVIGTLRQVQSGGDPTRLRAVVEHSLGQIASAPTPPAQDEPWVEVTSIGQRRWQVSLPEDIDDRLGAAAYASLEDRFGAVDGVTEAVMEDRDRAVVSTRHGMDRAELQHRLAQVIEALAST